MINKRFIVACSGINLLTDQIFEVEIAKSNISPIGDTDIRYLYPNEIQIINDCGAGIEWQSLASSTEYVEYSGSPSSFTFVRLPSNNVLQENFNSFGRCYKFIVRGYESTATDDLTVEFINYKPSLR